MTESSKRDYYCRQKFRYIKIDLESQTTYTCHAAQPHKIDFDWLEHNPGQLFNHDINVRERQLMLQNERAPSCEQNCWYAEDRGQQSPRLYQQGYLRTHDQLMSTPEVIDLTVGPNCNLSCSYCCKEYSSSWRRDLSQNGPYQLLDQTDNRYQLTDGDRVLMKINQNSLVSSKRYNLLLDEIRRISKGIKHIDVTGGEPFLNNQLIEILTDIDLSPESTIDIYSGLGVDTRRLDRMISSFVSKHQIRICASAECTDRYFEFNRYGLAWHRFQENLKVISDHDIKISFHSVLTNLTAFGFGDFFDIYQDQKIVLTFAYQPRMQCLHVMDDQSKHRLVSRFESMPEHFRQPLINTIRPDPTDADRKNMALWLKQFAKRRPDLDLSIYPKTFLDWLEQ